MSTTDEDHFTYSGSPRFGISDENSDEQRVRNRISNPQIASFWMRAMKQKVKEDSGREFAQPLPKWSKETLSDEATGLSASSDSGDSSQDDNQIMSSNLEDNVEGFSYESNESVAESGEQPVAYEPAETPPDRKSNAEKENSEYCSDSDDDVNAESDSSKQASGQPLRFAWWTRSPPSTVEVIPTDLSLESLALTNSKKQAALECLVQRFTDAVKTGADSSSYINILDAMKVVAETKEISSTEMSCSATQSSKTSGSSERSCRKDRHQRRKARSRSKKPRSPSNREIQEGILALSRLIEEKISTLQTPASIPTSRSSAKSVQSISNETSNTSSSDRSSVTTSTDINERIRYARFHAYSSSLEREKHFHELEKEYSLSKSTIEELKSLIEAQSVNLRNTLMALEHTENDRKEKAEALEIIKESDRKKNDFIVSLQLETTTLREELDQLHPAAVNLQRTNQHLQSELMELKNQYETLKTSEKELGTLRDKVTRLEEENTQLETDVRNMISCCTEYKKFIHDLQTRPPEVKPRHDRGLTRDCSSIARLSEPISPMSQPSATKMNVGCQASFALQTERPRELVASDQIFNDRACAEIANLERKIEGLLEEREEADDLLYLAKEEKKLLRAEMNQLVAELKRKEARISELEFMLECESKYPISEKSKKSFSLECPVKESDSAASTKESLGWFRNVFQRAAGVTTPQFGSHGASPSG